MKYIKSLFIALFSVLTFTACHSSSDSESETFRQAVTLDAHGTQQTVTLTGLKSRIDDVANSNEWLTVRIGTYTSGSPSIVLSAIENNDTQQRNGTVTITATSGDKVILAVTQQGADEQPTGIDDSHDIPTDQPAYSRQYN